jgi:hypothetical protein
MSPLPLCLDVHKMMTPTAPDRRATRRYPIALQLQYRLIRNGRIQSLGFGRTINIGSHGILFEADDVVPTSGQMELALIWPFLLQGSCGLQLIMRGRILRTDKKIIALKAEFHEFRTAGRGPHEKPAVIHPHYRARRLQLRQTALPTCLPSIRRRLLSGKLRPLRVLSSRSYGRS